MPEQGCLGVCGDRDFVALDGVQLGVEGPHVVAQIPPKVKLGNARTLEIEIAAATVGVRGRS